MNKESLCRSTVHSRSMLGVTTQLLAIVREHWVIRFLVTNMSDRRRYIGNIARRDRQLDPNRLSRALFSMSGNVTVSEDIRRYGHICTLRFSGTEHPNIEEIDWCRYRLRR